MAKKGDWVSIHIVVLPPEERAHAVLPVDTQKVPLEMWLRGYLLEDAEIGDKVSITTRTGREVQGTLIEVNPSYSHSFGAAIPELQKAGDVARAILFGGKS